MRLLMGLICEHASPSPDGKMDVHGIFHDLYAPGFPARQDEMVLVADLEWDHADEGRHRFRVDLFDPAGKPSLTIEGESEVTPRPEERPPPRTRLVMPLQEVIFPVPGAYQFQIRLKGKTYPGPRLYLIETEDADDTT